MEKKRRRVRFKLMWGRLLVIVLSKAGAIPPYAITTKGGSRPNFVNAQ